MFGQVRLSPGSFAIIASLVVGTLAVAACGGGSSDSAAASSGGQSTAAAAKPTATPAQVVSITIADNSFSPDEVTIKAGSVVRWVWSGNNPHSVLVGGLNSGQKTGSGTFEQRYTEAGQVLNYQCGVHGASMSGKIIVQ